MKDKRCKYPNCKCKVETFVCDNSSDFNVPHFTGEYEQTVYKKTVCKYEK